MLLPKPLLHYRKRMLSVMPVLFLTMILSLGSMKTFSQFAAWGDGDLTWVESTLNDARSDYFQGEVIPFYYKLSDLQADTEYTFTISYDHYASTGNVGGYAYMTTYNTSRDPDESIIGPAPGLDNIFTGTGNLGVFYTVNADIISASDPTGTNIKAVTVTFRTTAKGDAIIYWGLYLSRKGTVPSPDPLLITQGASHWSGGSLQVLVTGDGLGGNVGNNPGEGVVEGVISGMKYKDLNKNGQKDVNETGIGDWLIYMDNDADGFFSDGDISTVTDAEGNYSFSDLLPRLVPYIIREGNVTGWTQTEPGAGSAEQYSIAITAAEPLHTSRHFGNFICETPKPTISPASVIICTGSSSVLTSSSVSGNQWYDNGIIISGATNQTYSATGAGPYTVTVTLLGCPETSDPLTVTVNPLPTVNAGLATVAICQGATTAGLGGSVGGGATGGTWSDGGAGGTFSPGANTLNATYTAAANASSPVILTLTTSGGSCGTTFATKSLQVNPNPVVNAGGILSAICQGGTPPGLGGSLGGGATSATWSDGGAVGTFNPNATTLNATYTAAANSSGTVTLTLTTSGGSCGSATGSKLLTVNPNPTVNAGASIPAICQGGTTGSLGGSFGGGATSAVWSDNGAGGSFSNNTGTTPGSATYTASLASTSPVTLTLTTGGGQCGTISVSKVLTVRANPTVNVGGPVAAICQGGTTTSLGGSFGGEATSAVWSDNGAGGSFSNNSGSTPGSATYTASASSAATVTLTLTTAGGACSFTWDSKTITVNPNPTVNAGGAIAAICQGGTTIALGGSFGGGATAATWSDGGAGGTFTNNSGTTPGTSTYTASALSTSPVTLRLTTSGGFCGTTFTTKSLVVNPNPTVNVGVAVAGICQGGTTGTLGGSVGGGATGGTWSDGGAGGTFNPNATTLNATYTAALNAPGSVTLTLTTNGGFCGTTSANKTVAVNALPVIPSVTVNAMYAGPINQTFTVTDDGAGNNLAIIALAPRWRKSPTVTYTSGLPNGISLVEGGAGANDKSWTLGGTANLSPGTYYIQLVISDGICSSTREIRLNVSPQLACGTYSGDYFKNTQDASGGSATIHLSVTIVKTPINSPGDISTATLDFILAEVGGSTTTVAGILTSSTATTATFEKDVLVELSSTKLSKTFDVTWTIGGNYANGTTCTEDGTQVTVSAPTDDFVTGGGYIVPTNAGGPKGIGANGLKNNFGFNAKWNRNFTQLHGHFNTIIRRRDPADNNTVHTYHVKSHKPTSLFVYPKTNMSPARAIITYSNATIKDITYIVNGTCTSTPSNCYNEASGTVTFEVVDFGRSSGTNNFEDSVSILVKDKYGALWYSNNVYNPGNNKTKLDSLDHGNIVIHFAPVEPVIAGFAAGGPVTNATTTAQRDNNPTMPSMVAYPNPSTADFTINVSGKPGEDISIKIVDQAGRVIETRKNLGIGQSVKLGSNYKPGIYIAEISQSNVVRQLKLVKLR